ncbi:carboxypeptidase N subunit 2 [Tribolium castaneum]|uniref:carboxypeptidase N subunit 2 n=1 Tax=Tribolium castaneum TaxID=7070 RepID=UPI00046C3637|nr:PREDICTED: carboxypeptidase N subunit 2 [Tribolium castaneum]|eukprot:XP_008197465.1 PREDICTED: carboxypeptidase N subunit 2 [Tribolium castaneum]
MCHQDVLIISNELIEIERNAFTYCKSLQNLILYDNKVPVIRKSTFVGFWIMLKVSLENNHIERIEKGAFVATNINFLDLSRNKLVVIPADIFVKNSRLEKLSVAHNKLVFIHIQTLPKNLKQLYLDHNKLDALPDGLHLLEELKELTISHNYLSSLPHFEGLRLLEKLDVSFNNINQVGQFHFDNLTNLKYLDLSGNSLKKFNIPVNFKGEGLQQKLFLAFNRLRYLNFDGVNSELVLTLAGNPWNCKCLETMEKNILLSGASVRTVCDLKFGGLGQNPICVNDGDCSESEVPEKLFQKFRSAFQSMDCELFTDLDIFVN